MKNRMKNLPGLATLGVAVLLTISAMPSAFGGEILKANVPFEFKVEGATLPAGVYDFNLDLSLRTLTIGSTAKGSVAVMPIITQLAAPAHANASDSHLVFDVVGSTHYLSELWEPGAEGVLVYVTRDAHTHHILHFRR